MSTPNSAMKRVSPLVGDWEMRSSFSDSLAGRTTFEWMAGEHFLIQRFEVPHPEAPDGVAIIGFDSGRGRYLQHYFDSRGVARVYEMSYTDDEWRLWRTSADFTPLEFCQRFIGQITTDGHEIRGAWQSSPDGKSWEDDFELTYVRSGN